MKILIYSPQMCFYGGIERHVCLIAENFALTGSNVTLVTTSNSLDPDWRNRLLDAQVSFIEMPIAVGKASRIFKIFWLYFVVLWRSFTYWDIIYTNGQGSLSLVLWLASKPSTRRIHHHHTSADKEERSGWTRGFLKLLSSADEIVCCSQFTASQINLVAGRDDSLFLPCLTETSLAEKPELLNDNPQNRILRFGFFGRLVSTKGIETIIKLASDSRCSGLSWFIYGSGPDYPDTFFQGLKNVYYQGPYQTPEEQALAFSSLDAVALFSSHSEGMPISLIESMAAGLPWISSARGGTPELAISAANCELVSDPENYELCVQGLLRLVARIRNGSTSREEQRLVWESHFSPELIRSRWNNYFIKGNLRS